jgi:hypothetical protein
MVTGDKQGLRGTPKGQSGAKAKVGAKGEAKVFAGLKEGVSLGGALQWLNPEGFINPSNPKKADPGKAIAAFTDVASVSADVSIIQGLAASLGFECDYRDGNFVIAAKAGACLGLGGAGSVAAKVGAAQIGQFFMCIAHQLKQADYKKVLGLMNEAAFLTLNHLFYLTVATDRSIESNVGKTKRSIENEYRSVSNSLRADGDKLIKAIERRLKPGWGWFAYMPPESRGAIIASVVEAVSQPQISSNDDLRTAAAFSIRELISTTQSSRHLANTLDRITLDMGEEPGRDRGMRLIESATTGTIFSGCLERCELQLAKASPLLGRPFMRNEEPDFQLAQFPLHHAGYTLA